MNESNISTEVSIVRNKIKFSCKRVFQKTTSFKKIEGKKSHANSDLYVTDVFVFKIFNGFQTFGKNVYLF